MNADEIVQIGAEIGLEVDDIDVDNDFVLFSPHDRFAKVFYCGEKSTFFMQDYFCSDIDLNDRTEFDKYFHNIKTEIGELMGIESGLGTFVYGHRGPTHVYNFAYWNFGHGYVILTQDEFDIQMGLDVSIRMFWGSGEVEKIIKDLGSA